MGVEGMGGPPARLEPGSPRLSASLMLSFQHLEHLGDQGGCRSWNPWRVASRRPPGAFLLRPQRLGWPGKEERGCGGNLAVPQSLRGGPTTHACPCPLRSSQYTRVLHWHRSHWAIQSSESQFHPGGSATSKFTTILGMAAFAPGRERSQSHCRHTSRDSGRMRRVTYRLLRPQGKASRLPWDAPGTGGSGGAPRCGTGNSVGPSHPGLPGAPRLGSPRALPGRPRAAGEGGTCWASS